MFLQRTLDILMLTTVMCKPVVCCIIITRLDETRCIFFSAGLRAFGNALRGFASTFIAKLGLCLRGKPHS